MRRIKKLLKENAALKDRCEKMETPAGKSTGELQKMERFLQKEYEIRFNRMTEVTEFRRRNSNAPFSPVKQRELNSMCLAARRAEIDCWDRDISRYVLSDDVKSYHPFLLYLKQLPRWDGKERVLPLVSRVSQNDYCMRHLRRWMLAMVAQWLGLNADHANSVAPILVSLQQGKHKSTFFKRLMPDALQAYYTDSFNLRGKVNAEHQLSAFGLINMDEFDKEPAAKMPLLKNLMQMTSLNFVKSHQTSFCHLPRIASFAGTSNRKEILHDPSGSRRFICIEVEKDIDTSHIEHEQLYAQLKQELEQGERYWFTTEEETEINSHNEAFYKHTVEEEVFSCCFRTAMPNEDCRELPAVEIFAKMKKLNPAAMRGASAASFAKTLTGLGVERVHTRMGNLYRVVERGC